MNKVTSNFVVYTAPADGEEINGRISRPVIYCHKGPNTYIFALLQGATTMRHKDGNPINRTDGQIFCAS